MNEVAKKKGTEVSTDLMSDIFAVAGEGAVFDVDELIVPRIKICQAMSPELKKSDAKFIAGLSASDMFNSLTSEKYDGAKGIFFLPCHSDTSYVEFGAGTGGGFIGLLEKSDPRISQTTRDGSTEVLPGGNELVVSDNFYGLIVSDDGGSEPVIIPMASTKRKIARRWKSMIALQRIEHNGVKKTAPITATLWNLRVVDETNKRNETYGNFSVTKVRQLNGDEDRSLFQEAEAFRSSVVRGEVKAAEESPSSSDDGDDLPF